MHKPATGSGAPWRQPRVELWWTNECHRLRGTHPRAAALASAALRHRVVVLVTVAALIGGSLAAVSPSADGTAFVTLAGGLFHAGGLDSLADPFFQIGPVLLVVIAAATETGRLIGVSPEWMAGAAESALAVLALLVGVRLLVAPPRAAIAETTIGVVVVLGGPLASLSLLGHLEELLVTSLLLLAVAAVHRERGLLAGLLVGAAAGVKLWGILGVVVLVALSRRRTAAAAAAVLTPAACYLPFALWGHVGSFDYVWRVAGGAPLCLLIAAGHAYPWHLRVLQGLAAVICGAVAVARHGGSPERGVGAAIAARLLLDPVPFAYYGLALVVVLVVGAFVEDVRLARFWAVPVLVLTATAPDLLRLFPYGYSVLESLLLVVLLVRLLRGTWRPAPTPAARRCDSSLGRCAAPAGRVATQRTYGRNRTHRPCPWRMGHRCLRL